MVRPGFGPEQWRSWGHPHMDYHPYAWHARRFGVGRFGFMRRFFWFGFGAFAATAVARHHGQMRYSVEGEKERGEWDGGWHSCRRVEYSPRLVPEGERQGHWGRWGHGWHHRRAEEQQQPAPETPAAPAPPVYQSAPVQAATGQRTPSPPPAPAGSTIPVVQQQWEADMRNLTQQASNRVQELSEATIDSLVSGLQGLKTRLAEHRAETQKQLAEEEKRQQAGQPLALPVQQQPSSKPPRLV